MLDVSNLYNQYFLENNISSECYRFFENHLSINWKTNSFVYYTFKEGTTDFLKEAPSILTIINTIKELETFVSLTKDNHELSYDFRSRFAAKNDSCTFIVFYDDVRYDLELLYIDGMKEKIVAFLKNIKK